MSIPELSIEKQIEEIIEEAKAHGLHLEVIDAARKSIDQGDVDILQAYVAAFDEWIK
jgi:hypothetical protein